ncbi:MAG: M3 family metallopeptidase [Bacteroidales bacterium]|nr:M3 family metallopeptidase [Bacteroidales bacterium]MBR4088645.1 M3 family metallopeptidase [Bacteroidales bacterium]
MKKTLIMVAACAAISLTSCKQEMNNPLLTESGLRYEAPAFDKITEEHYLPAFEAAIAEGKQEIEAIVNNPEAPTFENTILELEYAGGKLNTVAGIFYNLNEANTNDRMQEIAEQISPMMTEYSLSIMLNPKLFERVNAVYEQRENLNLSQEEAKLLEKTYKGFADNGANLSEEDKAKYSKIQEELSLATLKFGKNTLGATNAFTMHLTNEDDLAGLPSFAKDAAALEAKNRNLEGWVITLQQPSYSPFMQYSEKRELREKLWKAYNSKCLEGEFSNLDIIKQIVGLRIEAAKLLGYNTYADMALKDRMAKDAPTVNGFLQNLLEKSLPFAKKDVKAVADYAKANGFKGELMPWDFSFYSEKLKKEKYSLNDEVLKPYFKLENVKEAVFGLANTLYGLNFTEAKDIPGYHPDVTVYDVTDANGRHMALFYADFFPRESKGGGAWMTSFREQSFTKDGKVEKRPHISIVCNFTKPTETEPSLLTFYEVTTFLHEFGHALHGILAEGRFASLTGTGVARDFVELPSQIMENWATEKEYLASFAKHYQTGEVIPDELIDRIVESKNYNSGYASVRQLQFGIGDMAWHSVTEVPADDVVAFEKKAVAACALMPDVPATAFAPSFGHIFSGGYAAGYYSYKWAEVLEADAFQVFKENGIFNKETAEKFRKEILSRGGIEDADVIYRNFRGRDPEPEALLKKFGMVK